MIDYLLILGLALVFGLAATELVRRLGHRLEVMDHPDGYRKVHRHPVPRIGGLAIFVAFFGALTAGILIRGLVLLDGPIGVPEFGWIVAGGLAVLFVGLWDDVRGLKAHWKLVFLTVISGAMYAGGFQIGWVSNPFGGYIYFGLLTLPVTLFWFLGCMNTINFIDGLDGLAAGVTLLVAATMLISGLLIGNTQNAVFAAALIGVTAAFLVFNFHPASIYLGDSGSYLLGFLIACIGLLASRKAHTVVALVVPVTAMGLPIFDTALAILRRWARAVPVFSSDRGHIHHKLLEMGLGHRQAVLVLYAACLALAGIAVIMNASRGGRSAAVVLVLALCGALVVRLLGWNEILLARQRISNGLEQRKRRGHGSRIGYEAVERMRQAEHPDAVWAAFTQAADDLEIDHAQLTISASLETPPRTTDSDTLEWIRKRSGLTDEESIGTWTFGCPLVTEGGVVVGKLDIRKTTGGRPLERHVPETLQLITDGLAQNLGRFCGAGIETAEELADGTNDAKKQPPMASDQFPIFRRPAP